MTNFRSNFTKKYSFIPASNAYGPLRVYQQLKTKSSSIKENLKSRLPMNLRLSKITNLEKSFISIALIFWASVEYLGKNTIT